MIIRHRGGCNGTTPRCRSRNIANNTFSEGWLQEILRICRLAGPASHPPCKKHCKYHIFMQNAAKRRFWDHTMGGEGGGVVANREPGSYILNMFMSFWRGEMFGWLAILNYLPPRKFLTEPLELCHPPKRQVEGLDV